LCFHFHSIPGTFYFFSYFFYDPLIIEQCVVQLPIVCVFSGASFVIEFWFYCSVIRQYAGGYSIFLYLMRLALCPKRWSTLEKVPWLLWRMYFVLFQDGIFCRHLSFPLTLLCH
jgi:hypothetical protein